MKLPDFTEFEAFNKLRDKMGADQLGYFELFDPRVHLTGDERSELERVGLLRKLVDVKVLPDRTLAIKNSRVIAYNPDDSFYRSRRDYPTYHVAMCSELVDWQKGNADQEYLVTSRVADDYNLVRIKPSGEVSMVSHGFVVCKHCLHSLRYKDYEEFRNRRRGYSQRVLGDFKLEEFFRLYQRYPLSFKARRKTG